MPDTAVPSVANAKVVKFELMGDTPLVNDVHWEEIDTKSIETQDMVNMTLLMALADAAVAATQGMVFRVDINTEVSSNRLVVISLSDPDGEKQAVFAFADIKIAHQFAKQLVEWTKE